MPPTVAPHLLPPHVPTRVLVLPGAGREEWRRWCSEWGDVRCLDLWEVAGRRAEAVAVFLVVGLLAAVGAVAAARLPHGLAALLLVFAVAATSAVGAVLLRRCAQLACDSATDRASAEAADFRPDVIVGHAAGAWVALRLRDRCTSLVLIAPPGPLWCTLLGMAAPQGIDAIARAVTSHGATPRLLAAAKVPVRTVEDEPVSAAGLRRLLLDDVRDSDSEGMLTASSRGASAFASAAQSVVDV